MKPIDNVDAVEPLPADDTVARSGETLRPVGLAGRAIEELASGARQGSSSALPAWNLCRANRYLHADGESAAQQGWRKERPYGKVRPRHPNVLSFPFGPDHAPLEQRQVNQALQEAETLRPSPRVIVFAAFQFDPEAAKDIDETNWPGITLLKAQMNADLLTEDLKRKRASNESFWLIGQPDVHVQTVADSNHCVSVQGFDYYNTKTGDVESGGRGQDRHVDARHGLRRPQPLSAPGLLPYGRLRRRLGAPGPKPQGGDR